MENSKVKISKKESFNKSVVDLKFDFSGESIWLVTGLVTFHHLHTSAREISRESTKPPPIGYGLVIYNYE